MKQRKDDEQDWHGDQRGPRNNDERHIDNEAQGERAQQQRQRNSTRPQESQDGIGKRHHAKRKLLTLIDMVFDEDATLCVVR